MSKKKKPSWKYIDLDGGKKKKNKKGDKKPKNGKQATVKARRPELKRVKPSLDRDDARANRKEVRSPVKVSKDFLERRERCNHADGTISVDEYRRLSPAPEAYSPELNQMVEKFGEANIRICERCFQVVVARDVVDPSDVRGAVQVLRAACAITTSHRRLGKKEIRRFNRTREALGDFNDIITLMEELGGSDDDDEGNLDRNRGMTYVG